MTRSRLNVTLYSSPFGSWHRIVTENESFSMSWTGVPAWAAVTFAAASRAAARWAFNLSQLLGTRNYFLAFSATSSLPGIPPLSSSEP